MRLFMSISKLSPNVQHKTLKSAQLGAISESDSDFKASPAADPSSLK
jgi:hypothetical protein